MLRMYTCRAARAATIMPRQLSRRLLRPPGCGSGATLRISRVSLLHSGPAAAAGRTSTGKVSLAGALKPGAKPSGSAGLGGGGLPAWIPCSGSVTMVMRTAARGFRSTSATSRAAATEATNATEGQAVKLYLGYPPRVWAMGAGHCAFVMLASMYLMTDMVLLRVLGIIANAFDMFYCFLVAETPLWLNIRWGAFYVLVNVVQLGQIYMEQREVAMDPAQKDAFDSLFRRHGFTQTQFVKLWKLGVLKTFHKGEEIVTEGQMAESVVLLLDGEAEQLVSGNQVMRLHDGAVAGATEYLKENRPAADSEASTTEEELEAAHTKDGKFISTVRAVSPVVHGLCWDRASLRSLGTRNPAMEFPLSALLSEVVNAEQQGLLAFSRLASYRAVVAGVLADDIVTDEEHAFLVRYRRAHAITVEEHGSTLRAMGVSVPDYNLARERHIESLGATAANYSATLAGVLSDGVVDEAERAFLQRYRAVHTVDDAQHRAALARLSWSEKDFERGSKEACH